MAIITISACCTSTSFSHYYHLGEGGIHNLMIFIVISPRIAVQVEPASIPFIGCPMFSTHMPAWLTVNQSYGFSLILFTHFPYSRVTFSPLRTPHSFICSVLGFCLHLVGQKKKYFRVNPFDFVRLTDCRLTDWLHWPDWLHEKECLKQISGL